ncbi:hypothetical protein [Oceanirhabdus sp. W0125-5]|uniref:hypothetical protein n=1 Tax=Oceanirhabdus sp. W0125-5 TaxID=2999116 RepID=UPI0022F2B47E|nr:hypothetical protein [Oceanirhabdus sp. W0125-5]WBW96902.1 hypothetical protein OW730_24910 [Oceanirhabdus sp. W0125-5]
MGFRLKNISEYNKKSKLENVIYNTLLYSPRNEKEYVDDNRICIFTMCVKF